MTKKFSRLTSVTSTSWCPRSRRSRWRAVATPPHPPPSTTIRTGASFFTAQMSVVSRPSEAFVLAIDSLASSTVPVKARMASIVSGMTIAWLSTMYE